MSRRPRSGSKGGGLAAAGAVLAAVLSLACAKTMLHLRLPEGGSVTVELADGRKLMLSGPAELDFLCRTWGDSYFEATVGDARWTCSGGKLSENGAMAVQSGANVLSDVMVRLLRGAATGGPGAALPEAPAPTPAPAPVPQ